MSNDESETVDDFHRSHNSLLGERVPMMDGRSLLALSALCNQ